jgi:hypothetical protein
MKPALLKFSSLAILATGLFLFSACHTTDNTNSDTTPPPHNDKMGNMPDSTHKDKDSISDGGRLHDNGGAIDTALPKQPTPTK